MDEITKFGVVDYCIFAATLLISVLIGAYFSFKGSKSTEEFLMGDRSFGWVPVSMSLLTSFVSAISLLGYSGESYAYGSQMFLFVIGATFGMIFANFVVLPVLYPLKLTSVNEYILLRFKSQGFAKFMSLFTISTALLFMGICLYAPTIALVAVTDWDQLIHIILLGTVCTIYSTFGGIRAVIWTDVFQFLVMMGGIIVVNIAGTYVVGGVEPIWNSALTSGRLNIFNMNPSLYERHNFYNVIAFGAFYYAFLFGIAQINVQRVCAVSTISEAKWVLWSVMIGMYVTYILIFYNGLMCYAAYDGCDPLAQGKIKSKEGIMTYFLIDRLNFMTGLSGVFVATLIGGTLSSISSVISAIVAMVWKDILLNYKYFKSLTTRAALIVNMVTSSIVGTVIILLAIVASKGGSLVQFTVTVLSVSFGPLHGVFLIGFMFPHCTTKSALPGCVLTTVIIGWIAIGAFFTQDAAPYFPLDISNCTDELSITTLNDTFSKNNSNIYDTISEETQKDGSWLDYVYGISYTLYSVFGTIICIVLTLLISLVTGHQPISEVPPIYISPFLRKFYYPEDVSSDTLKQNCGSSEKIKLSENISKKETAKISL